MGIFMNCEEFLKQFREALDGKVPESVIQENVNYYKSYICSQTAGGRTEEEVLKMLGDPRLLAKTIEGSIKFASTRGGQSAGFEDYGNNEYEDVGNEYGGRSSRLRGWIRTCVVMVVVFVVFLVVLQLFVPLAPLILTFMAVSFLVKVLTRRRD